MQPTTTLLLVSMVESLRNCRRVGCKFAILRGTTSPLPNHQMNTRGRQRIMQRALSDFFRRISDITLGEGTMRSISTNDVIHRLQPSSAMKAVG